LKSLTGHIWRLLERVQSIKLRAATTDPGSFFNNARAAGNVTITKTVNRQITFHETGVWTSANGEAVDFRNTFQWSLNDSSDAISLVHLRYGIERPIHLADFVVLSAHTLQSAKPHACGDDRYSATLSYADGQLHLHWVITGPKKDDRLDCIYLSRKTDLNPL